MKVKLANNDSIETITHYIEQENQYRVEFVNYEIPEYNFGYREKSIKEFIFKGGFAISGAENNGCFGIVNNGNYYYNEFSKGGKSAWYTSQFWTKEDWQAGILNLKLKNKTLKEFSTPVNLLFSVNEYWHWFCEDIPTLEYIRKNNFPIITNILSPWQRESLSFFPDVLSRVVEVQTPAIINAPEFHTFVYPAVSLRGKTNRSVSTFLSKHLTPSKQFNATELSYISRGDAVARCVENEKEVIQFLSSKGFKCYDNFSKRSLQEKIDIFARSKMVVSPTGSNLTHCHAMQPGTTVIDFNHIFELTSECGWNSIGVPLGIRWISFPAITGEEGPRSGKGKKQKNNNLKIDIQSLNTALEYANNKRI